MDNLRQAAQQALEALERGETKLRWAAITALRAALAEPEQEPDGISWLKRDSGYFTAPTPRKPLTDEEIGKIAGDCLDAWSCARAIERAHGIGDSNE